MAVARSFFGELNLNLPRDEDRGYVGRRIDCEEAAWDRLGRGSLKCNNRPLRPEPGTFAGNMRLRVDDITAEARELEFPEPEGEINRMLGVGAMRDYSLDGPVKVNLSYYRAGTELFLQGEISAVAHGSCARCAEEFTAPRSRPFRYVLAPRSIGEDTAAAMRTEDLEFTLYDGDDVDLSPLIREQTLLAYSTLPLCREDCRGLCPRCGVNLNEKSCACRIETGDPRLAVLRNLKVRRPD